MQAFKTNAGFIAFTLTAALQSGEAAADVDEYWGTQLDVLDPGSTVTVHDSNGTWSTGAIGDKGIAVLDIEQSHSGEGLHYEVVNVECGPTYKADEIWLHKDNTDPSEPEFQHRDPDDDGTTYDHVSSICGVRVNRKGHIVAVNYDVGGGNQWYDWNAPG